MVINKSGVTIRIGVDTLREMGRATQGVKIIRLKDDDSIASVAKVSRFETDDEEMIDKEEQITTADTQDDIIENSDENTTDKNIENNDEEI